jgi:hypothetical protein
MEDLKMKDTMKLVAILAMISVLSWHSMGLSLAGSSHEGHGDMSESHPDTMEHSAKGNMFTHQDVVEGVRAEFQVMSLASMNMKDPEGNTHHIMVKFFNEGMNHQIKDVVGKIKVIGPSGKEQVGSLKNYSGVYATNFTFGEKGKYGVICLFKVDGQKRLVKFWYPHG